MLDRTIPFYNLILRCDHFNQRDVKLPRGFKIVSYCPGDEKAWAKLEYEIGDFDSLKEAKDYFVSNYLKDKTLYDKILFLLNEKEQVIGSYIAWTDERKDATVSSLHWLVLDEAYQGRGLGRALCISVMNKFNEEDRLPVYIHTQPWSYKAILLYISLGFKIQRTDTFSHYENQFDLAMETLGEHVTYEQWIILQASVE